MALLVYRNVGVVIQPEPIRQMWSRPFSSETGDFIDSWESEEESCHLIWVTLFWGLCGLLDRNCLEVVTAQANCMEAVMWGGEEIYRKKHDEEGEKERE
ncbi:unnamed protein product [Prunus armeniaca]|uniref:Uncharacterized protein n=1 Tax=Prunus armeniaca TaxID=36596 RepID=A0A6J5XBR6_PRUAR|nr:unnamed protein product [Prunus armeniaca]